MAMLAETRRKQKWTLNPRGKQWSEDSNKFGQKMLEKMGWTSGKGLGANEQGMTEHVKVSHKNDQSGIGFKDTGDQWTQHQADFNNFLSQLQEQNSNSDTSAKIDAEKDESLEIKSKQSRARVHYHKFTRGKDVKKYSSKDLANIFGKKELKDAVATSKVEPTVEEVVAAPKGSKDNTGGVLTIKGGNIDEYFKNRLPNFMKNGNSNGADDFEDEYEPRLGFGFGSGEVLDESQASNKDSEHIKPAKSKAESNGTASGFTFANEGLDLDYPEKENVSETTKLDFVYDNPCLSPEKPKLSAKKCTVPFSKVGFVNPALNLNDCSNEKNNGAEFEVSRVEFGLDNNALDLSDEDGKKKRVTFNDKVEYNTDVVKKKKKKGKSKLDKFEVDNTKLKKKAKEVAIEFVAGTEVEGFVNEALDIEAISDEINDNELNERKTKKSKRRKNRRESNLETIEEIAEENSQIDESEVGEAVILDEAPPRKNKKLKKNPESEISLELNTEISEIQIEAPETKKKGKKDKKVLVLEEPVSEKKSDKNEEKAKKSEEAEITVLIEFSRKLSKSRKNKIRDESQSSETQHEAIEPIETKKKKKKRSKSKFEGKDNNEIKSDEASDQVDIPKSGSATKRKISGTENGAKLTKRSKLDHSIATEDAENVEQNTDISVNTNPPSSCEKKGKRSKKIFKSLFAKAPILYFSGSNINEMAGYGAEVSELKR